VPGVPQLAASASNARAETFREVFFILLFIVFAIWQLNNFMHFAALLTEPTHNIQRFFQKYNFREKIC
jgi:flagellar biogenesis protein FliO